MPLEKREATTGSADQRCIQSSLLTTCETSRDGQAVRLHFIERSGNSAYLELPFDQAQSVVMTLPRLLTSALQARMGAADARYVFPVDQWTLEIGDVDSCLILTLRTDGGFEACFGLPFQMCREIGQAMDADYQTAARTLPGNARRH